MKITIDINDADIRSTIKELIKQQVISIVRDEYREIIKAEVERKADKLLKVSSYEVRSAYESVAGKYIDRETIEKSTRELVEIRMKYFDLIGMVNGAIEEKLEAVTKLKAKKK
jgi:hypothetical protein